MNGYTTVAKSLVSKLNEHDLGAYIYHTATTGSIYIRFSDPKLCSIRIGDHEGRTKYSYKFNLRKDIQNSYWVKDGKIWRFYCPFSDADSLVALLVRRREETKNWETKFEYQTPSFKKFEAR